MAEVFGLSAITAGRVRAVTRGDAGPAERLRDRFPAGSVTLVRCVTGGATGTGRLVTFDAAGTRADAGTADVVLLQHDATTGPVLVAGHEYLAVRVADSAGGVPQWKCLGAMLGVTVVTDVSISSVVCNEEDGTITVNLSKTTKTLYARDAVLV